MGVGKSDGSNGRGMYLNAPAAAESHKSSSLSQTERATTRSAQGVTLLGEVEARYH